MSVMPEQAAEIIRQAKPDFKPQVAIVLGSGLGRLAEQITDATSIAYHDIPGYPVSTVVGHSGQMILGYLESVPVVCLQGRPHRYEGTEAAVFKTFVRTLKLLGCEIFLATNASGSLRKEVGPGSLVLIKDHINMQGFNPLIGENQEEFGERFFPLDNSYDFKLREQFQTAAKQLGIALNEGVYLSVLGPNYETAAEIRAFQALGADVVGMSTVPEVLVARHCGLRVAVLSTITNLGTGLTTVSHSHEAVCKAADLATDKLCQLISKFLTGLESDSKA